MRLSQIRYIVFVLAAFLCGLNLYAWTLFRNTKLDDIAFDRGGSQETTASCPVDAIPCRFEGHCPVGTTCVMKPECKHYTPGVCEPYYSDDSNNADEHSCIDACVEELQWDERMYYHATTDIISKTKALSSRSRPNGCVVRYRRNHNAYNEEDEAIRQEWLNATQHQHVVRVDPVANSSHWQALCFNSCKAHEDCAPAAQVQEANMAFLCISGSCQRNRFTYSYWTKDDGDKQELVLVTGANELFFHGLSNLAASARYWARKNRLIVYNLGLSDEQLQQVESWPNILEVKWKDGIPKSFPPHVSIPRQYAWKPLAIQEALKEHGMIVWVDAGSTLVGPLDAVQRILEQDGILLVKGQDADMKPKSADDTFKWFGFDKDSFLGGASFSGNFQAYLSPSRYVDTIVNPNAECALHQECIAPNNSNLTNHRYDQTSLSILAYKMQTPHHTEYIAGGKKQLNTDLDRPSSRFVVWTARKACRYYLEKGY